MRGFVGKHPALMIRHLPSNGWSIIRIKTTGQGGLALAGATINGAWFDEPPKNQRIFTEVQKRIMRAGRKGSLLMTMTPVNARVDWIRELAEAGGIVDHHHRLEPHELIPVGQTEPMRLADGTVCNAAWVAEEIAKTLPHERPVVCHGEWNFAAEGAVFSAFRASGPLSHVRDDIPEGHADIVLGIDHGVRTHTQTAVLCAIQHEDPDAPPNVWVIDTYTSDMETSEAQDAEGILQLLERNGLRWDQLTHAWGDRAHYGSSRKYSIATKSNTGLMRAIERVPNVLADHGIRPGRKFHPPIRSAKKGVAGQPGSVAYGCTWLHRRMLEPSGFQVHPRCQHLIEALQGYDMTPNSPESHLVDALRYALRAHIFARVQKIPTSSVRIH